MILVLDICLFIFSLVFFHFYKRNLDLQLFWFSLVLRSSDFVHPHHPILHRNQTVIHVRKGASLLTCCKYLIYILHWILSRAILGPCCTLTAPMTSSPICLFVLYMERSVEDASAFGNGFCLIPMPCPLSSEASCSPGVQRRDRTAPLKCDEQGQGEG